MDIWEYRFIHQLKKLPFIDEIWVFGSRARQDANLLSDIDLAVIAATASDQQWHQVEAIVDNADTLLKIDLIRFDLLADDKFKENILKHKKIIYKKGSEYMDKAFWIDYFNSLDEAIKRLEEVTSEPTLDAKRYIQDAAIQRFEFCIELYWKVLKKFLSQDFVETTTPRDVLSKAFQFGLIHDEQAWIAMMVDRNKTSHVYKQAIADEVFGHLKGYATIMRQNYEALKLRFNQG